MSQELCSTGGIEDEKFKKELGFDGGWPNRHTSINSGDFD